MGATGIDRFEAAADGVAAAIYAASAALVLTWLGATAAYTIIASAVALAGCLYALRSITPERADFRLAEFAVTAVEPAMLDELILTEADFAPGAQIGDPALLLDDVLAQLGPDSRVVRLFDRDSMPTPGQLKARIDRHLG
jgi:hypothetical protein